MAPPAKRARPSRRRALLGIVGFGLLGGLLIAGLELLRYRFLLVDPSVEIFAGLTAALFAALGIWLGRSLRRRKVAATPAPAGGDFVRDEARAQELGLTPRELEILGLIADGLSNREVAGRLFVSENTVKTHLNRLFDKIGAKRRTQAVQIARASRLIP